MLMQLVKMLNRYLCESGAESVCSRRIVGNQTYSRARGSGTASLTGQTTWSLEGEAEAGSMHRSVEIGYYTHHVSDSNSDTTPLKDAELLKIREETVACKLNFLSVFKCKKLTAVQQRF